MELKTEADRPLLFYRATKRIVNHFDTYIKEKLKERGDNIEFESELEGKDWDAGY